MTEKELLKIIEKAKREEATRLGLNGRRLGTLPAEIGQLINLSMLGLEKNQLSTLPAEIGQLANLRTLNLESNRLSTLPAEIGQLTSLRNLGLGNNQLSTLPAEIGQLTKLGWLSLEGNPIPIPPEILSRPDKPSIILDYWRQHLSAIKKPLREIKMLLVGQGGVGKTQVANLLLDKQYNEIETKTEGIDIHGWQVQKVKVNLWDFGGQEIMHATHQFFLTKRSLYLLVWDARQEDRYGQIDYWLKLIQSFGADSPIIVVLNKIDIGNIDLDRWALMQKYPTIKGFIRISCKTGKNFEQLKSKIATEISQLEHLDDELPQSWFEVKEELQQMKEDFIDYSHYQEMCRRKEIEGQSQKTLIGFLHDLGIVLNFQDDSRLRHTSVLKPEWVTNGVYKIINHPEIKEKRGIFKSSQLEQILPADRYPEVKHSIIIDMMKKFELCFSFEEHGDSLLIPELLPVETPSLDWNYEESLGFQYHYNFFPMSILSRFIVRMHRLIFENRYWRSGVILADEGNTALIRADRDDRKIFIWVTGQENTRRDFLAKIRRDFEYIHYTIPKIEANEMIPLYHDRDICVDYKYLLGLEREGDKFYRAPQTFEKFEVKKLLAGIGRRAQDHHDLRDEKIRRLRRAYAIESDAATKFKLENQIDQAENE